MAVREERDNRPKRKTWLYLVGQIILWWYFHLVFRMKVVGAENVPKEGPVLLCSNHLAKRDPVLLGLSQRRQVFYMAKEEDAYALLAQNGVVGVFIEGHRSKDGRLLKPKTGAALLAYETKAPVVPVCITAGDGLQPGMFKRTLIRFGKPISAQELNIQDDSSMQLRRASRTIMGRIAQLREESCKELGLPSQLEPAREAPAQEAPHES